MVARAGGKVAKPETRNEPHIGNTVRDERKPATRQTGIVRGGTTNPLEGDDGSIKRESLVKGLSDDEATKPGAGEKLAEQDSKGSKSTKSGGDK